MSDKISVLKDEIELDDNHMSLSIGTCLDERHEI